MAIKPPPQFPPIMKLSLASIALAIPRPFAIGGNELSTPLDQLIMAAPRTRLSPNTSPRSSVIVSGDQGTPAEISTNQYPLPGMVGIWRSAVNFSEAVAAIDGK